MCVLSEEEQQSADYIIISAVCQQRWLSLLLIWDPLMPFYLDNANAVSFASYFDVIFYVFLRLFTHTHTLVLGKYVDTEIIHVYGCFVHILSFPGN